MKKDAVLCHHITHQNISNVDSWTDRISSIRSGTQSQNYTTVPTSY